MPQPQVNFLNGQNKILKKPKKKIKLLAKFFIYLIVIFIFLIIALFIQVAPSGENFAKSLGNLSLWGQFKRLISSEEKQLKGEEDRINILLLGIGGAAHEGPHLTDTLILASFKPSTNQVALISIPRDLYVVIPGYGWQKINHVNAYGELNSPGQGGELAAQVVSQIFNLPIHYYARIDFEGFVKIINELGGIEIEVENTLDDFYYPVPGQETATTTERFEHLHIEKGIQKMDGELALKYVRSRRAIGIEGSDFARAKRQQKVLLAIKDKALSITTLFNPLKISGVLDALSAHLSTDLEVWEIFRLYKIGKEINEDNIIHRVLDDSPDGPLYSFLTEEGVYVLLTKSGDFSEISEIAENIFEPQKISQRKTSLIEIQNGTKINGLASKTSQLLRSLGYQVVMIRNAPTQDYQKTVIYNLNPRVATATQESLKEILGAEIAETVPPWSQDVNVVNQQADILIILGQDLAEN